MGSKLETKLLRSGMDTRAFASPKWLRPRRRVEMDAVNAGVGKELNMFVPEPLRQKRHCRVSPSLRLEIVAEQQPVHGRKV